MIAESIKMLEDSMFFLPDEDGDPQDSVKSPITVMSNDHDKISAANQCLIFIREKKRNSHHIQNHLTNQIDDRPDSHFVVGDELCADGGGKHQEHCHSEAV